MCVCICIYYTSNLRRGHKFEMTVVNRRDLDGREKCVKTYKYSTYEYSATH